MFKKTVYTERPWILVSIEAQELKEFATQGAKESSAKQFLLAVLQASINLMDPVPTKQRALFSSASC